jgi:hypothetical protein
MYRLQTAFSFFSAAITGKTLGLGVSNIAWKFNLNVAKIFWVYKKIYATKLENYCF